MKNRIAFSKGFLPCAVFSCLLILSGIFSFVTRGLNLGIDFKPGSIEEVEIKGAAGIEDIRAALSGIGGVSVKKIGSSSGDNYQIRAGVKESEGGKITEALVNKYGEGNVEVLKTDFIGSSMSSSLARQSIFLLLGTMLLIWIYATIRFHWDFALGAIVALIHDICVMFTFITWSQLEFSTTTLAAVLTIVGYSINATVVILDRVRYNLPLMEVKTFKDLLDQSLSDTLVRSIITTATTLFAVLALYFFTSGSVKDFALAMTVGLVSGCYSSIFISSGFISFVRRDWKPEYGIHHARPKKLGGAQAAV